MIESTLSKAQAEELFEQEAVLFGTSNAIPEYRIVELFGERAGIFIEEHAKYKGYLEAGSDYSAWGSCTPERPMLRYLCKYGFFKIVSEHNYHLCMIQHNDSAGGKFMDALWKARSERLDAMDAEDQAQGT